MAKTTLENKQTTATTQETVTRTVPRQQLIHLMRLVETSNTELAERINNAVDENPALEIVNDEYDSKTDISEESPLLDPSGDGDSDDFDESEYDGDGAPTELSGDPEYVDDCYEDSVPDGTTVDAEDDHLSTAEIDRELNRLNAPEIKERTDNSMIYAVRESQMELWQRQLGEMEMTPTQADIAYVLLGSLENNGFFTIDLMAFKYDLENRFDLKVEISEIEYVLTHFIQTLEPIGTGARDLRECLLLQLKNRTVQDADTQLAIRVLEEAYDAFINKKYPKIRSQLSISQEEVKRAFDVIKKLDPHPVDMTSDFVEKGGYITPDFIIRFDGKKLNLELNKSFIPKVAINKEYQTPNAYLNKDTAKRLEDEANRFIREYVDKGNQFIMLLETRDKILYNTMYAIMKRQEEYFMTGDESRLRPMILKDIADVVGVDIATVSRVSNSKYVLTDFGTKSLKSLFSEAVNSEDVSSKAIKSILNDVIKGEDKSHPYSDEKLCEIMKEKGFDIARRTIAKYREQLKIPTSHRRKVVE